MELQHIIWSWEMLAERLLRDEPELGRAVFRSCRPIAAQRYRDGRLLVVLGCWYPGDQQYLGRESSRSRLSSRLSGMLSEQVIALVERWPGGVVNSRAPLPEGEQIPAPDVLRGLPDDARDEASKCESAIQRLFFARAYAAGLHLVCQYQLLNYRLDFALPKNRTGADVLGWDWRATTTRSTERSERQEQLEMHGWQILLLSGSQVLNNVDKCVGDLARLSQDTFTPGQGPLPTRYSSGGRKPFSSLGTHLPAGQNRRGPRRPW